MEDRLSQDYLDRITRSVGGTVAKPAQPNVRSDAASQNEAATAVAGAGPGVPAWKAACHVERSADGYWSVHSPRRSHWMTLSGSWIAYPEKTISRNIGTLTNQKEASEALAACTTCPPDWPTPAHADDPREEPERFDEATGPMPQAFPTIKPKPVDSIEKLIDRLAKVNGAIDVSHGMAFRVFGANIMALCGASASVCSYIC